MLRFPKDTDHLVRMAALFLIGAALFLVVRALLVPHDFYTLGHFRTGAVADNMARPMAFAGNEACAACHPDVVEQRKGSRHATVACEACHWALAKHADDPGSHTPARLDARTLCLRCHRADTASPKTFKQVNPEEHMGNEPCVSCHRPHHPETT